MSKTGTALASFGRSLGTAGLIAGAAFMGVKMLGEAMMASENAERKREAARHAKQVAKLQTISTPEQFRLGSKMFGGGFTAKTRELAGARKLAGTEAERKAGWSKAAFDSYERFYEGFSTNVYADDARFWAADLAAQLGNTKEAERLFKIVADDRESNFRQQAAARLAKMR